MRKVFAALAAAVCFVAVSCFAACGDPEASQYTYTGENLCSISISMQEPADYYAPGGIALIRSMKEAENFQKRCAEGRLLGEFADPEFQAQIEKYGQSYFRSGELLILFFDQSSGCGSSDVIDIAAESEAVRITVDLDDGMDGDYDCPSVMMQDIHFIELPRGFCGDRAIRIEQSEDAA